MENHRQTITLLILLKRLDVKFNMSHGYIHQPIEVLGKFSPNALSIDNIFISTEEL